MKFLFLREELYRHRSLPLFSAEKIILKDCTAHWENHKKYQTASNYWPDRKVSKPKRIISLVGTKTHLEKFMNWWLQREPLFIRTKKENQIIGLKRNFFFKSEKQQKMLYKPLVQARIHIKITYAFFPALFDGKTNTPSFPFAMCIEKTQALRYFRGKYHSIHCTFPQYLMLNKAFHKNVSFEV